MNLLHTEGSRLANMTTDAPGPSRCADWAMMLQASGYRMTLPRQAVLAVLDGTRGGVLDVTQILALAQQHYPMLGKATVYRTLERMEALGFVRKIHSRQGCHSYAAVESDAQPLVVCVRCGRTAPAPTALLVGLSTLLVETCGYRVALDELQIAATCPECR